MDSSTFSNDGNTRALYWLGIDPIHFAGIVSSEIFREVIWQDLFTIYNTVIAKKEWMHFQS